MKAIIVESCRTCRYSADYSSGGVECTKHHPPRKLCDGYDRSAIDTIPSWCPLVEVEYPTPVEATDEHLINALKMGYKHAAGDEDVGTSETMNALCDALCNLIGDEAFCQFCAVEALSQQEGK